MYRYHFSVVLYCSHQHNDNYDCPTSFLSISDCRCQSYKPPKRQWLTKHLKCSLSHRIHQYNAVHRHIYDMTKKKKINNFHFIPIWQIHIQTSNVNSIHLNFFDIQNWSRSHWNCEGKHFLNKKHESSSLLSPQSSIPSQTTVFRMHRLL